MDNNAEKQPKLFGLLGRNISYSFSRGYFSEKFAKERLAQYEYTNFDIPTIAEFPKVIAQYRAHLAGMNVTIPYKEAVFPFLDEIDAEAREIGAINTIKILENNKLKGYNTDVYGFEQSLKPLLQPQHQKALILGTGGASKAVAYAFKKLQIDFLWVSRTPANSQTISYAQITKELMRSYTIVVNCSPVGTFPNISASPAIPYQFISAEHILFDLIYNPKETSFLTQGKQQGASIKNGYEMLVLQAEKAWEIWNL